MVRTNLDMDVLRTFVAGVELGSFARAADRLGRSQSALSGQLRKLEDQVGQPLLHKSGRGLALTPAGESLLGYARRILELNDQAVETLRGAAVEGWVRLGLPQDFAESWLPGVLGRFARAHPRVRVEVRSERNQALTERVLRGELDLALVWGDGAPAPHAAPIAQLPIVWIAHPDWTRPEAGEPLALIAFEAPCVFRGCGVAALDAAGIAWRVVFTSASLAGLWAAAEAGLGVTLRTPIGMPKSLRVVDPGTSGLPVLPPLSLALLRSDPAGSGAVARLADILHETITREIADLPQSRVAVPVLA